MKITIAAPQVIYELGSRANQEDALWPAFGLATESDRLFIVCDGMGGHDHGEVASQTVATTIGHYISEHSPTNDIWKDALLTDALAAAYDQLDACDNPDDKKKMGTTLTLLCLHRDGATMAHIGDSRIYHLRPSAPIGEQILYQSRDHSLAMDLYLAEELTFNQIDTYENKNVITRAMQPRQERRSRPDVVHTTDLRPGDLFLLCSDGIVEQLTNNKLLNILCSDVPDHLIIQRLRSATKTAADNHTAYLIRIIDIEPDSTDTLALNDEATSRANFMNIIRAREADRVADSMSPRSWIGRILDKWFK